MERPGREELIQKILALLLAGCLAAAAALQQRSPLARAMTAGEPWRAWLVLSGQEKSESFLYLAVYRPKPRLLDLIYVPAIQRPTAGLLASLPDGWNWENLPLLEAKITSAADEQEPSAQAKAWLLDRPPWSRLWACPGLSPFDRFLLRLELARLAPSSIHPAWLAEDSRQRAPMLARLLAQEPLEPANDRAMTVEIFNGSGKTGLASHAKKILRLQGVDVVATGNMDAAQTNTLIYDRTGRYQNAEAVRRMLDCPSSLAVTRIDPKRLVDVSVMLADDCRLQ